MMFYLAVMKLTVIYAVTMTALFVIVLMYVNLGFKSVSVVVITVIAVGFGVDLMSRRVDS
jgi:hypothetical protein